MRLLARVAHACIEGSIFIYTSPGQCRLAHAAPALYAASKQPTGLSTACIDGPSQGDSHTWRWTAGCSMHDLKGLILRGTGFRTFFVVQNAALLWYVGPKQSVPIACKAVFACSLARGLHVLASNGVVSVTDALLVSSVPDIAESGYRQFMHAHDRAESAKCEGRASCRQNIYLGLDTSGRPCRDRCMEGAEGIGHDLVQVCLQSCHACL